MKYEPGKEMLTADALSLYTPQSSRDTPRHHYQPCEHHTWQENWVPDSHPRWPAKTEIDTVYWPGIKSDIKPVVESCPTYQCHHPQEPQQLLQPTLAPKCPWQLLSTDYFHFDGSEYLVVTDYCSKMAIRRIPAFQCNASKTISVLKEHFAEYGIPEVLHSDNGPQFANALFTKFATDWKFDHNTNLPRNCRSNG